MPPDVQSRLGALEARSDGNDERWDDVKQYMIRTGIILADMTRTLGIIVNNQGDFKKYQETCDLERKQINEDANDLEKRVTETEGFQSRQVKAAVAGGSIATLLFIGGAKVIEKFFGWLNG